MYYSLCWTQQCMTHNSVVSIQVAACTYKNSVFFDCVFDRRSDYRCGVVIWWSFDNATIKNSCDYLHEEYFIGIPMKYALQSTASQWYADQEWFYCGKYPRLDYRWFLCENDCLLTAFLRFSPDLCYKSTLLIGGVAVDFHFFPTYCSISWYDRPWPPRDSWESKSL